MYGIGIFALTSHVCIICDYALILQNCTEVLEALCRGDLGPCSEKLDEYKLSCHQLFGYASVFGASISSADEGEDIPPVTNGVAAPESEALCHNEQ